MATELGSAYISVGLGTNTLSGDIKKAFSGAGADGDAAGKAAGSGFSSGFKGLVGPAIAAIGAIGFSSLISEAARASDATDKFKSTMNFAGIDTSGIEAATAAAKSYADQTVYDLPTIQATMAQLASNGVSGYTELTEAAGNLNAVAGGNADTFKSVSMMLTQTAGAGKLSTENWNQLADAIPGASGPLQKALQEAGAYTGNFRDAMAEGQITSDEFNDSLLKLGMDPVAVEASRSVTTFEGAIGGLQATINSGLMSALDAMKPAITGAINLLSKGLGGAFAWVGNAFTGLRDIILKGDFTGALTKAFGLEEDSPAVSWLLQTHDIVTKGIPAIRDILVKGDFTGAMTTAFGVEEDSPVVDWLFRIRETVLNVMGGIRDFMAGFTVAAPNIAAQLAGSNGGLFTFGLQAKDAIVTAFQGIRDFLTGFTFPPVLDPDSMGFTGMAAIGATVRDVFGQIGAVVGPLIGPMFDLWSAVSPLQTLFQALAPSIQPLMGIFGTLATSIGGGLLTAITGVLPAFQQIQGVMVGLLTDVLATVLPVVVQLVGMFAATLATLIPILVPIITQVVELAATLISQLAPIFMELVSTVLPMVVTIFGAVLQAIGPLISMVAGLLIPIIQALMPVVVTVFGVIADVIGSVMQIVMGVIQVVTGIISGNWAQVWTGIGNIFKGIWDTVVNVVRGALQIVGQVVISGLGLVGNFVGSTLAGIGRFFGDTWNNVVNGVSGMIGNVVGFFSGLGGKILGALGNIGATLFNTGKNIIQGLIDGIGSMMGSIGRAVLNIVPEAIRGPFEQLLGIHSPSRVFRGYGVNIGQGLILGIGDMHSDIESAVTGMVSVPKVPSFSSSAYTPAGVSAAGLGNTFNTTINQVDDPIGTSHAVQRRLGALAV